MNPCPAGQVVAVRLDELAWIPTGKKTANGTTGSPACFSL